MKITSSQSVGNQINPFRTFFAKYKPAIQLSLFVFFLWLFALGSEEGFYFSNAGRFLFLVSLMAGPAACIWGRKVEHRSWGPSIFYGVLFSVLAGAGFMIFMTLMYGFIALTTEPVRF